MRIGLNATCFNERPSGAKQRFSGIYGALIERCPDTEFVIYEPADCRVGSWFEGAPNVTVRRTPLSSSSRIRRALRGLTYWPSALARDGLDLFETFHLPLVKAPLCPTILTVHDRRPVLPDVPLARRAAYRAIFKGALRNADHIVTVSDTMKQELVAAEPATPVTRIYNGINAAMFTGGSVSGAAETRRSFGLPDEFILAVGHLEARKNYVPLIEAVARLREAGRTIDLIIVGNDGGERKLIEKAIARLGLAGHITILQGISDPDLVDLYALCALVAFPSYYEGFGIPVLEAMAARRPLVLSDIPVFRELTEGKGVYFAPDDPAAIADRIDQLLSSPDLQQRLIEYGDERVRAFSFPNLAGQVEHIYRLLA